MKKDELDSQLQNISHLKLWLTVELNKLLNCIEILCAH